MGGRQLAISVSRLCIITNGRAFKWIAKLKDARSPVILVCIALRPVGLLRCALALAGSCALLLVFLRLPVVGTVLFVDYELPFRLKVLAAVVLALPLLLAVALFQVALKTGKPFKPQPTRLARVLLITTTVRLNDMDF